jgi:hypothetical protein
MNIGKLSINLLIRKLIYIMNFNYFGSVLAYEGGITSRSLPTLSKKRDLPPIVIIFIILAEVIIFVVLKMI